MKPRLIYLSLFGLWVGACSSISGPALLMGDESFSAWLVRPGSDPVPDLRVKGGTGEIVIQGAFGTPCPCYEVQAYVDRGGSEIDVTISAIRRPVICIAVVATFAYQGTLHDLAPGSYRVRITHSVDDHPQQVLDTTVSVS